MPVDLPPTSQQLWAYRHRRPIRVTAVIAAAVMVVAAIVAFVDGSVGRGLLYLAISLGPLSLLLGGREIARAVESRPDPHRRASDPTQPDLDGRPSE